MYKGVAIRLLSCYTEDSIKNMLPKPLSFEFVSYSLKPEEKLAVFDYKIEFKNKEPLFFQEKIIFPKSFSVENIPSKLLENILSDVHIILGISYYKLYCPSIIKTNKSLSKEQAEFWNVVYRKGLGEFFYRNKISPKIKFPFNKAIKQLAYHLKRKNRSLLGIGGGKDSIVAGELLKEHKMNCSSFMVETQRESEISLEVAKEMGAKTLRIKRFLDEKIFLPHENAFNGHVPISAVFAFLGYLSAVLYDYSYVIVGNEYSSNFGNIEYGGEMVNHQWSKSAEFENLFQEYTRKFLCPDVRYFSLLRHVHEIRIAEMFSKYKKYFPIFTSCNRSFKIHQERSKTLWCGECPKCVFAFTILSPFLSKKELLKIFGKNLYEDKKLLPLFKDILGFGQMKPFDCVGTFDESRSALFLARDKFADSLVLKTFLPKIADPERLIEKVMKTNPAPTLPANFKLLGIKNLLILGYGKEGKASKEFIKKYFPKIKIGIADKKDGSDYMQKQEEYDLVLKTPGIPKRLVTAPYTTATNIFFSQVDNPIIGITGSKGKSTTSSLIYSILKEAGKKVTLLGNIGYPMLEKLMKPVLPDEIFVLELSSYQLDDLEYSPHIAVLLNCFPEHMNYHGDIEKYYDAKANIAKWQNPWDYFIYNQKNKKVKELAKKTRAKTIPFNGDINLEDIEVPLKGKHNEENIKAAIAVARLLSIPEETIKKAIEKFKPLPHRLEFVGEFRGIKFYDDAISTTPESTIAALEAIPHVKTIFLGGEDRGYDFSQLEKEMRKRKIENVALFPNTGKRILKSKKGLNILDTSNMKEAVAFAYKHTPKGSACLLSTASPSYSLWKNFEEKGNEFQKFVKKLKV